MRKGPVLGWTSGMGSVDSVDAGRFKRRIMDSVMYVLPMTRLATRGYSVAVALVVCLPSQGPW